VLESGSSRFRERKARGVDPSSWHGSGSSSVQREKELALAPYQLSASLSVKCILISQVGSEKKLFLARCGTSNKFLIVLAFLTSSKHYVPLQFTYLVGEGPQKRVAPNHMNG